MFRISQNLKRQLSVAYDEQSKNRNNATPHEWKLHERSCFLQRLLHEQKHTLLEIGAGPGKDSQFFAEANLDVHATDLSEQMIERCREKGLRADVMSFDERSFDTSTFDAVWSFNCLLHVPKDVFTEVLQGIHRVIKQDGLFYMGVYGGIDHEGVWEDDFYHPKRFFSFYKDKDMERILQSYFSIVAFHKIPIENHSSGPTHFQGFTLRK